MIVQPAYVVGYTISTCLQNLSAYITIKCFSVLLLKKFVTGNKKRGSVLLMVQFVIGVGCTCSDLKFYPLNFRLCSI